jgi:asparagine synthase (glutamine-hydrolysing)
MCGIAGYFRPAGLLDPAVLECMLQRIHHRGPDGAGVWTDPAAGVAFAHSRLKILDLTAAAHQPMRSADGTVTLIYNGEIYNFAELRDELRAAGAAFKSTGDTEVLLELCRRDPKLRFLPRLNGMFAFAAWHAPTRTLSLARDRTGVKPLLYAAIPPGGLAFASEMAAIRPAVQDLAIDAPAVLQLLTLGFVAAPRTIFAHVHKLRPGCLLRMRNGDIEIEKWAPGPGATTGPGVSFDADATSDLGLPFGGSRELGATPHAGLPFGGSTEHESAPTSRTGARNQVPIHPSSFLLPPSSLHPSSLSDACASLRTLVADAVRLRFVADVPVGVFLSGGIDSSIVTAVAAKVAAGRVKTFSVTFPGDPFYDESRYAKAVADLHGTDHTFLPLSIDEVRDIIPTVQAHLGEPFADSSALPTYLLSRLTRGHVTVALSGDGADELFAGYNRYAAAQLIRRFGWFARTPLYRPARWLIERLPAKRERRLGGIASQLKRAVRSLDSRLPHRYANWMRTSDDRTFARLLHEPASAASAVEDIVQLLWQHRGEPKDDNDLNRHLRTEWALSLPDDMLMKVDLMSMAHGLEVRSPFLDYRVVDFVFPLDWRWKLSGWKKKHLLIEAFKDDLPPQLHNRPKKGFEVPVGPWLRGPLNRMARDLIHADRCFFGTLLSREGALATLDEHAAGRADHNFCLWALVSLLSWQQQHAPNITIGA